MDQADADFGSVNPLYVELPGATPSKMVVAIAKDGHMYLLDAAALRGTATGAGGQKVDFMVANGNMAIHTAPASYRTAMGLYVVLSTTTGAICPPGSGVSGRAVVSVRIAPRQSADADGRLVRADVQPDHRADRHHHRRAGERDRLVHERRPADGRRWRHGRFDLCERHQRHLLGHSAVELTNRGQRTHRRRRRQPPLLLVNPLSRKQQRRPP